MDNQLTNIGIVRESRNDENRTPLVPEHIKKYKESNPNINFIIQPSNKRCFSDKAVSYTHLTLPTNREV